MLQFHETVMGKRFFNRDVPKFLQTLEKLCAIFERETLSHVIIKQPCQKCGELPKCSHNRAFQTSGGWHCPECGEIT